MVTVLEGIGKFTVGGKIFILNEGETLIMPKDVPHAVYGDCLLYTSPSPRDTR